MMKVLLFCAHVFMVSAFAMELKELNTQLSPQAISEVIKIPAITTLLGEAHVTVPLDTASISCGPGYYNTYVHLLGQIQIQHINPSYAEYNGHASTDDQDMIKRIQHIRSKVRFMTEKSYCCPSTLYTDGPNRSGTMVGCVTDNHSMSLVVTNNNACDTSVRYDKHLVWSLALSEGNRIVVSGTVAGEKCARLLCYAAQHVVKTKKILFFPPITMSSLFVEKEHYKASNLTAHNFHLFKKLSFITEDLLIGLNQEGKLYSIIPHFNEPKKTPTFFPLACKLSNARYVSHFAVDSCDKHSLLVVDDNEIMYAARVSAKKLALQKIKDLKETKRNLTMKGLKLTDICTIQLVSNKCLVIFNTSGSTTTKIKYFFNLISKQPSPNDKLKVVKSSLNAVTSHCVR